MADEQKTDVASSTASPADSGWPYAEETPQQRDAMDYQRDVLQPEDVGLCESVFRGLQSRGYNQGRFVVDPARSELSEHGVHHFQQLYVDAMGCEI